MTRKKIALMVSWATLIVFVLTVITLADAEGDDGTRAPGNYVGPSSCSPCHDDIIDNWTGTNHSQAWVVLNDSGEQEDWCEVCHSTGAEDLAHGGFDPVTDQPEYLKNVSCEACHGPGEDHVASPVSNPLQVNYSAELCSSCHRIASFGTTERKYHPYYNDWLNSSHSRSLQEAGGQVVTDPNCRSCHVSQVAIVEVFEGGTFTDTLDDPQPITCPTCHDPHSSSNPYQLRRPIDELCASCHHPTEPLPGGILEHPQSAMRNGTSDIPPSEVPSSRHMENTLCAECHMYATMGPPRITGHEFIPKPEACAVCHDGGAPPQMDVLQSSAKIEEWQGITHDWLYSTTENVTVASRLLSDAEKLGFSEDIRNQALALFNTANYSLTFVEADGSEGVHNPTYAWDLLNYSNEKANELISLLETGSVKGKIKDDKNNPIEDAQIVRDGFVLALTAPNGSFTFDHAPGVFTFEVAKNDQTLGSITDVQVVAGETSDIGTKRFPPVAPDLTLYVILGILVVIIVLAVLLYWHRQKET